MFKCTHCGQEFEYGFHTRPGGLKVRKPLIPGRVMKGDDTCPRCEDGILRPILTQEELDKTLDTLHGHLPTREPVGDTFVGLRDFITRDDWHVRP